MNSKIRWKKIVGLGLIIVLIVFIHLLIDEGLIVKDNEGLRQEVNALDQHSKQIILDVKSLEEKGVGLLGKSTTEEINHGTMALIRSNRYGYFTPGIYEIFWQSFAGNMPLAYINYFDESDSENMLELVEGMEGFSDPVTGGDIDFVHMIAVVDVYLSDFTEDKGNVTYEEAYYDYLLSWGGDLESFSINLVNYIEKNYVTSFDNIYDYVCSNIGSGDASYFSEEDLLADIDGVNIAGLMKGEDLLLSEAIELYYTSEYVNMRYELFINSFGGEAEFREAVHLFINGNLDNVEDEDFALFLKDFYELKTLMLSYMDGYTRETTPEEKQALEDAFIQQVIN